MLRCNYNIRPDAIKNLTVCNLDNNVFCIAFDTKQGREVFQGVDKKQVVAQAALRIKRVCIR